MLDATKLIPEEEIPVEVIGRMTLNRNVDNFFAETEQVAFLPTNILPGIDFSNDPLLQGRLFSYLDTQKSRLGTTNFHQIPINAPKCPFHNFQRDGLMQTLVPTGRANYEPNSLAEAGEHGGPRACPETGFSSFRENAERNDPTEKLRVRAEAFADHYSQARLSHLFSKLDRSYALAGRPISYGLPHDHVGAYMVRLCFTVQAPPTGCQIEPPLRELGQEGCMPMVGQLNAIPLRCCTSSCSVHTSIASPMPGSDPQTGC